MVCVCHSLQCCEPGRNRMSVALRGCGSKQRPDFLHLFPVSQFLWPHHFCESHSRLPHLFQASICQIKSPAASTATATMKLPIKSFMEEHKDSCPCNDIPCTRQGHCPKWLLATSKGKTGYCAIKSSCLSHDNLQNLIMSYDRIPLPAVFGEAVDCMEKWGAFHWSVWMEKSLKLMHEHIREDNMHRGVGPTRMRLFHDCILLFVQWDAGLSHHSNSAEHYLVLTNWNTCHWVRCCEVDSFHQLAADSVHHVRLMMESIERDGPATTAFQSDELQRLTRRVNVVPESPASNTTQAHLVQFLIAFVCTSWHNPLL